jgi:hypothetical protein
MARATSPKATGRPRSVRRVTPGPAESCLETGVGLALRFAWGRPKRVKRDPRGVDENRAMLKEGRSVSALGTPYQLPALSFDLVRRGCPKAGARIGVKGTVVRPCEVSRDTQGPKARDQGFIDRAVEGPGGSQTVFTPARGSHNRIGKLTVVQDLASPCGAADRVDPPRLKGKCVIPMECALIPTE